MATRGDTPQPRGLTPERCTLYHNNGNGTFTEVTQMAGITRPHPGFGLTAAATDSVVTIREGKA